MSDEPAAFRGDIPKYYDRGLGPMIFADYAVEIAERVAHSRPARVLETAAGTGIVTRQLRDRLPRGAMLTATDLQPPMLEVARTKFVAGEEVAFTAADATELPFADDSFDAVVCQFGVMFFPDKDRGYREVHRVLTSGGRYHFSVWDSHAHNAFARITHGLLAEFFPVDPPQFQRLPFSYAFDPIKESLLAANFTDINASVIRVEKDIPDLRLFASGLVYGSPIVDQVHARGGVAADDIFEALVRALAAEFGDPGRMTIQALMFSARKP